MRSFIYLAIVAGLMMFSAGTHAQPDMNQIPQKVMDGLKAKFPNPHIDKWTKEKEGEIVIYDFEFTQGGHKFEADVKEDGTIINWEKAIAAKDLPAAVRTTINKKYPKAKMKDIMEITAVNEGKHELEGYEIVLVTTEMKEIEVTVAPDGKMLEDPGAKK